MDSKKAKETIGGGLRSRAIGVVSTFKLQLLYSHIFCRHASLLLSLSWGAELISVR